LLVHRLPQRARLDVVRVEGGPEIVHVPSSRHRIDQHGTQPAVVDLVTVTLEVASAVDV
jgi:hypothetical protein